MNIRRCPFCHVKLGAGAPSFTTRLSRLEGERRTAPERVRLCEWCGEWLVLDGKTRGYVKPNTTQSAALSRNDSVRIARAKWLLAQRLGTSYPLYEEWTRFKSMALSKIAKILPTELDAMRDTAGLAGFYAGARSAIMLIDRVLDSADLTEEEKDAIADTILAETEEFFKDLIGPHPL